MASTDYQKLPLKRYPRIQGREDAETRYWKKFKNPVHFKEYAPITSIQFCPQKPLDFAVTSSARVQIYSTASHALKKTISRFKAVAHGASYRQDGKLLAAGDESGLVQIFDLSSRAILRTFRDHTSAVHLTRFLPSNTNILSVSDDRSVRISDLTSSSVVHCWQDAHADYVRAGTVSKTNPNLVVSGSYDHTVKLWDLRANQAVVTLQHGNAPVESVLMFPGDNVILSAGGNELCVWDILGGAGTGRLLHSAKNHQKTITSMCFDNMHSRVFTASLDHHVKIYDVKDYRVTYSLKYPAPLLAVGISPDDTHIVAGMASGLLSIRERSLGEEEKETRVLRDPYAIGPTSTRPLSRHEQDMQLEGGTFKYFLRGMHKKPSSEDYVVQQSKKPKLLLFERHLRSFQYGAALDAALTEPINPRTVMALLEELILRGDGLKIALAARDDAALEPILLFIDRYLWNPRYTDVLCQVFDSLLNMYAPVIHSSPPIAKLIEKIRGKAAEELEFQKEMHKLVGVMDMMLGFTETTLAHGTVAEVL